jgi:dihydrofolate reductase
MISIIVAATPSGVIGSGNSIPWRLPEDLKLFKSRTLGSSIIMGKNTWDSLPRKPLIGRVNYVISRGPAQYAPHRNLDETLAGPIWSSLLQEAITDAQQNKADDGEVRPIFIIGGAQIYELALKEDLVERIILSRLHEEFQGDKFFKVPDNWIEVQKENYSDFDVVHFERIKTYQ